MKGLALATMAVSFLVSVPSDAVEDKIYLARCIEGEHWWGDEELGSWIAHAMLNRVGSGWWSASVAEEVKSACHGHVRVGWPSEWAFNIAGSALSRNEDLASGSLFFLSDRDLAGLNLSVGRPVRRFCRNEHCLNFYRDWPGGDDVLGD